ncbi:MAG TPA: hypothetical protein VHN36_01205 [Ilumatobacteraceae bacterium]|nr:hypothetical protein [Ilumatobacteraceae bacterium]
MSGTEIDVEVVDVEVLEVVVVDVELLVVVEVEGAVEVAVVAATAMVALGAAFESLPQEDTSMSPAHATTTDPRHMSPVCQRRLEMHQHPRRLLG